MPRRHFHAMLSPPPCRYSMLMMPLYVFILPASMPMRYAATLRSYAPRRLMPLSMMFTDYAIAVYYAAAAYAMLRRNSDFHALFVDGAARAYARCRRLCYAGAPRPFCHALIFSYAACYHAIAPCFFRRCAVKCVRIYYAITPRRYATLPLLPRHLRQRSADTERRHCRLREPLTR